MCRELVLTKRKFGKGKGVAVEVVGQRVAAMIAAAERKTLQITN